MSLVRPRRARSPIRGPATSCLAPRATQPRAPRVMVASGVVALTQCCRAMAANRVAVVERQNAEFERVVWELQSRLAVIEQAAKNALRELGAHPGNQIAPGLVMIHQIASQRSSAHVSLLPSFFWQPRD